MMRQLGGSFGIALVNTYLTNRNAVHRSDLVSHLTPDNPLMVQRLEGYTHYFLTKGATLAQAHQQGLLALNSTVNRQSSLLSYCDAFLIVGIFFLLAMPLLLLATRKKQGRPAVVLSDH